MSVLSSTAIDIQTPAPSDFAGWRKLFQAYAEFYRVAMSDQIAETVWSWLLNPSHEVEGLIAKNSSGDVAGLIHFRTWVSTFTGKHSWFIDDLIVADEYRGQGIGQCLINHVKAAAQARGALSLWWITRDDNYRARSLYDRIAKRADWVTYELDLQAGAPSG